MTTTFGRVSCISCASAKCAKSHSPCAVSIFLFCHVHTNVGAAGRFLLLYSISVTIQLLFGIYIDSNNDDTSSNSTIATTNHHQRRSATIVALNINLDISSVSLALALGTFVGINNNNNNANWTWTRGVHAAHCTTTNTSTMVHTQRRQDRGWDRDIMVFGKCG